MGVVVRKGLAAKVVEASLQLLNYCIPLMVGDCPIVAMWPTRYGNTMKTAYPKILTGNLLEIEPLLGHHPTIIAGDMNCYVGQGGRDKGRGMVAINEWLNKRGLISAYHSTTGETLGNESQATLNFLYKGTSFFHIDYAYTNAKVKTFHMAKWADNDWKGAPIKSDHTPLMIEI